jgi:hypothetical protein
MTPEELKAAVSAAITAHVEAVAGLDSRAGYFNLKRATQKTISEAVAAFCDAQASEIAESREVLFIGKYGQASELVRAQYIKLLEDNSRNDSMQHTVWVAGYNARGAHHWGLRPEAYSFCKPDERIKAAFAVIDAPCMIEEKPHSEQWAN